MMTQKRVIVIGGGSTGCATAHDLVLRGFEVILVERGEIGSGTTGRCSCFLHSGARYSVKDPESAIECIEENTILKKIMPPRAMEENGGVFVLLGGDDPTYVEQFFEGCASYGIPTTEIAPKKLFAREPNLTRNIRRAVIIPDAIVEALRFALSFAATARVNGGKFLTYTEVKELLFKGDRVIGVRVEDRVSGRVFDVPGDLVVNAAGPWVDKIATMVGVDIPMALSPGVHVILGVRLSNLVINRMHLPSSGDFIAPQRNTSILGTSSWSVEDCDYLDIRMDHVQEMIDSGTELTPVVKELPIYAVNAATRPLLAAAGASERDLSRTFKAFDHAQRDDVEGFVTIAGGKLVTARAMAEKISDMVCQKFAIESPCQTQAFPLTSYRRFYTHT